MNQPVIRYSKKGYVYSALLHGALMLLLMNMDILVEVEEPEFYELSLGSVSRQRIEQILDESAARRQAATPEERIEVPERRMIEIEEPTISVPSEQRIESRDIMTEARRITVDVPEPEVNVTQYDSDIIDMDRKESFQGSRITVGEQPGAGIETGVIGADEAINFTIEGEIEGRKLLSNPLPQYPEGLNQNATIRISCRVLPDGAVSSSGMVPVRKENATLEELAMNSLKTWRFEPLQEGSEAVQQGIVTFAFKLK